MCSSCRIRLGSGSLRSVGSSLSSSCSPTSRVRGGRVRVAASPALASVAYRKACRACVCARLRCAASRTCVYVQPYGTHVASALGRGSTKPPDTTPRPPHCLAGHTQDYPSLSAVCGVDVVVFLVLATHSLRGVCSSSPNLWSARGFVRHRYWTLELRTLAVATSNITGLCVLPRQGATCQPDTDLATTGIAKAKSGDDHLTAPGSPCRE